MTLTQTASAVRRELDRLHGFYDDPITRAAGIADEIGPLVNAAAAARVRALLEASGYTADSFYRAVADRTTAKFAYEVFGDIDLVEDDR